MDVKVRAELVDGQLEWTIDGNKPQKSVITLPWQTGPHTLHFHIDDNTESGLSFADDAIWVHENENGECPGGGIQTDQISVVSVKPSKLTISNANNGAPRTLHYQLNIVDRKGTACPVDPAIKNGGGTT